MSLFCHELYTVLGSQPVNNIKVKVEVFVFPDVDSAFHWIQRKPTNNNIDIIVISFNYAIYCTGGD
jgi:hypothetical protein